MSLLYPSAFMEALGWSLVDSFWKMGLAWIVYTLITADGKRFNPEKRYFLSLLLMTAGTIWSFSAIAYYYRNIEQGREISALATYFKDQLGAFTIAEQLLNGLSAAYIVAVLFHLLKMTYRFRANKLALATGLSDAGDDLNGLLNKLKERIGISKRIKIWLSVSIDTPLTAGFFKPAILLPVAALNQLSLEQTEAVIAHELFHIRRNDYLANFLLLFSEVILFFNPFSHFFRQIIRKERELVCDDGVLALGLNPWQYANALYTLGKYASERHAFALAAAGNDRLLLERISRIINVKSENRRQNVRQLALRPALRSFLLFFLCLGVAVIAGKRQPQLPAMEQNRPLQTGAGAVNEPKLVLVSTTASRVLKPVSVVVCCMKTIPGKPPRQQLIRYRSVKLPVPPPAPPAPSAPEILENLVTNSFVSGEVEPLEYSFSVPRPEDILTDNDDPDGSMPYIPSSTFFYSHQEGSHKNPVKKIIHL